MPQEFAESDYGVSGRLADGVSVPLAALGAYGLVRRLASTMMTLPEYVKAATNVECPICGGEGWVCENHPDKPWETGTKYDCQCGGAGMPCRCTNLQ